MLLVGATGTDRQTDRMKEHGYIAKRNYVNIL
jgi:hypothetical protein